MPQLVDQMILLLWGMYLLKYEYNRQKKCHYIKTLFSSLYLSSIAKNYHTKPN